MSLTHDQVVRTLAPVWLAFERSQLEIEAIREEVGPHDYKALGQLQEISEFIGARARGLDLAGLHDAIERGGKRFLWPNLFPAPNAKAAIIAAWIERNPKIREAIERRKQAQGDRLDAALRRLDEQRAKALEVVP